MVGMGFHHGSLVLLPNSGGQWNYNFSRPVLSVQAVGESPEEVRTRREAVLEEIATALRRIQAAEGTSPKHMISTRPVPASAPVVYADGHRTWALGVIALLGLGMSAIAAVLSDRFLSPFPVRRLVRVRRRTASVV
jgi:hypothetical protein